MVELFGSCWPRLLKSRNEDGIPQYQDNLIGQVLVACVFFNAV